MPSTLLLTNSTGNLSPNLDILEDPSGKLTLHDIITQPHAHPFSHAGIDTVSLGYTQSVWWARFDVKQDSAAKWVASIYSSADTEISFYYLAISEKNATSVTPITAEKIKICLLPSYLPNLTEKQLYRIYIRFSNAYSPLTFKVIWQPKQQGINTEKYRLLFFSFMIGSLLLLALYNLFLFFSFYDKGYLILVGFIICITQEIAGYLWSHFIAAELVMSLRPIILLVCIILGINFFCHALQTKTTLPLLDKFFIFSSQLVWSAIGLAFFVPIGTFVPGLIGIILLPTMTVITCGSYLKKYRIALKFIWAVIFLCFTGMPFLLYLVGLLTWNLSINYLLAIGFLGFFLLLSLLQAQYTQDIRQHNTRMQAASHAKSQFLATMNHELRTPLNTVSGINGLLAMTDLNAEQENYLYKLDVASKHMLRLIDTALDFSMLEYGLPINAEAFNLTHLLDDIKLILQDQAAAKKLKFIDHRQFDKQSIILGDATRLAQVLLNLASNAIKFTEQGRVDIFIYQQASIASDMQTLYFEVCDTGIGMNAQELKQLFQPFTQTFGVKTKAASGFGLGLVISQRIVRGMGGELEVDSIRGKGSRFFFTLQFAKAIIRPQPFSVASRSQLTCNRKHILLVDDDEINAFVVRRFLETRQMQITVASNGQEALQKLDALSSSINLIFMDLAMPIMDGYETTQKIRALGYTLPIIALTARAIHGERERCIATGMNDFFTKPFALTELEQLIYTWTDIKATV